MPSVHVHDIDMYYEITGNGDPILVIWGIGGEIPGFAERLKEAAIGRFQVVLFDNRGSGRSDKPDIPYSIEMMAKDTAGLMNAIGSHSAHVLGISTGARIAIALAAQFPDRVRTLTLHVAAARSPDTEDPGAEAAFLRLRTAMTTPGFAEKMLAYPPTIASFLRQFNALREFDGRPLLPLIRAPALIVNCTCDPSTPVRYAEELRDGIAGARLVLLEGDHMIARSKHGLVIKQMLAFLEECGARNEPGRNDP